MGAAPASPVAHAPAPRRRPPRIAPRCSGMGIEPPDSNASSCQSVLGAMPDMARILGKLGAAQRGSARPRRTSRPSARWPRPRHAPFRSERCSAAPRGRPQGPRGCRRCAGDLDAALDEDPPAGFDEGGVIRPGFTPEIDSLRAMTRDARGFLLGLERLERERTGIKTLKVGHNKVFGYYIEVSPANAHPRPRSTTSAARPSSAPNATSPRS